MAVRILAIALLCVFCASAQVAYVGRGCTTARVIDWDCDGYGVGEAALGPDADDNDVTVYNSAQALAKYGTLTAYLQSRGYNPTRILHVSAFSDTEGEPSFSNSFGSGYRKQHVTATKSSNISGDATTVIDGDTTTNGPTMGDGQAAAGEFIQFDFGTAVIINNARFIQSNTASHGVWQWQRSTNGSAWTNIGATFTLGGATEQTFKYTITNANTGSRLNFLAANLSPFRYYRLVGVSGTMSAAAIREIEFATDYYVEKTAAYANHYGTGNRIAKGVTVTTNLTFSTGTASALTDGLWGTATFASQDVTNKWIKFHIGRDPITITEFKWFQSTTASHGTWKWQGSMNDSAWTDIGSTFTLGGATTQTQTGAGTTVAYRYYRLLGVSGTASSVPQIYEVDFKTAVSMVVQPDNADYPYNMQSVSPEGVAAPGDVIVFRGGGHNGISGGAVINVSGTETAPIVAVAYPGELPIIVSTAQNGITVNNQDSFQNDIGWQTFDGFRAFATVIALGEGFKSVNPHHIIVRNTHLAYYNRGTFTPDGSDITFERCSIHDSWGSHNSYPGANSPALPEGATRDDVQANFIIRDSLLYKAAGHNIHLNGRMPGFVIENNYLDGATNANIMVDNTGPEGGIIRNNYIRAGLNYCIGFASYGTYETLFPRSVENVHVLNNTCVVTDKNWLGSASGSSAGMIYYRGDPDTNGLGDGSTQSLSHAAWTLDGVTIDEDSHSAELLAFHGQPWKATHLEPADTAIEDTSTGRHGFHQETVSYIAYNGAVTGFLWAQAKCKPNGRDWAVVSIIDSADTEYLGWFNCATGAWGKVDRIMWGKNVSPDVDTLSYTGTGNGTLTRANPAVGAQWNVGAYTIECTATAPNGGTFVVKRPDGTTDGTATVGVLYDGEIRFTIADGSVDFALGAKFTFTPKTYKSGVNIINWQNGWYKFSFGVQLPVAGPVTAGWYLASANGTISYEGDGTSGMYFHGFMTSYHNSTPHIKAFNPAGYFTPLGATNVYRNNIFASYNSALFSLPAGQHGGWENATWDNNMYYSQVMPSGANTFRKRITYDRFNPSTVLSQDMPLVPAADFSTLGPNFEDPIVDDPRFESASLVNDYNPVDEDPKLQLNSPAVNAGAATAPYTTIDMRGVSRSDGAPDLGAWERSDAPDPILLVVTPTVLSFTCEAGGPATAAQSVTVSASGGTLDHWGTASNFTGTHLSIEDGTSAQSLQVWVDCRETPGTYTGTLTIESFTDGIVNSPQVVNLTLHVTAAATPVERSRGRAIPRGTVEWK
jgi:hypothetical protein